MTIIMNINNEIFCFSWCFSLVMVHMEVLDCHYKYGRYFMYLSWQEILFSILLTANEYVEKALKVCQDP